jgi:hypothetical protein
MGANMYRVCMWTCLYSLRAGPTQRRIVVNKNNEFYDFSKRGEFLHRLGVHQFLATTFQRCLVIGIASLRLITPLVSACKRTLVKRAPSVFRYV